MNKQAHANIMEGAFAALPTEFRESLKPIAAMLPVVGNYPDIFDNPTLPEEAKNAIDRDWKLYCTFPKEMAAANLHSWPYPMTEQAKRRPITRHWLTHAIGTCSQGDQEAFIKFVGCLSHWFGDVTQPAHLVDSQLLAEMLPPPPALATFHYHTDLEAVTGACGPLRPPQLLGLSVEEVAWRQAAINTKAIRECRRYIVPVLEAIFAGKKAEAVRHSEPPVTLAAQLTLDIMYTALRLAAGNISETERTAFATIDLRTWNADLESHDLVYGAAILDGNRNTPPAGAPVIPAKLLFANNEKRPVRGLGVLPHSGMNGPRTCWMNYSLPVGVFSRFESIIGMNTELTREGAADFVVFLDDQEVFRSGKRTVTDPALPVSVKLGLGQELKLQVEDVNDAKSFWNNHAYWGEPKLVK